VNNLIVPLMGLMLILLNSKQDYGGCKFCICTARIKLYFF